MDIVSTGFLQQRRGSALLSLVRLIRRESRFYYSDGPTGPIHKVNPYRLSAGEDRGPYHPGGVAIKRKKIFGSWDRLNFPLPGTRAVLVIGQQLFLPVDGSREEKALALEEAMDRVEKKAAELL